jgi:hypothetical protein
LETAYQKVEGRAFCDKRLSEDVWMIVVLVCSFFL